MKLITFCLFLVLLNSCATKGLKKVDPPPVIKQADLNPRSNLPKGTAESYLNSGKKFFQNKDYQKSFDYFVASARGFEGNPKQTEAYLWAIRSSYRLNRYPETAAIANLLLDKGGLQQNTEVEIYTYKLKAEELSGDHFSSLNTCIKMITHPGFTKESESLKIRSQEIVYSQLIVQDLEKVAGESSYSYLRGIATFKLGELALEEHNQNLARNYFSQTLSYFPNSDYSKRAEDLLEQLDAVRRVEPRTIGTVLPLTGRHAALSQKTLRAIEMGLGLYGNNVSSFKLAVMDSEGNPDLARRGVEQLVKEDNVIAIVGSMLSRTSSSVAAKSNELGVPSISLSQKSGITELGPNVFRNSLTSEMQIRHLVRTAMEDLGMRRFAVLYPNDAYGIEFTNIFWDEVLARGGQITGAQTYSNKETDFRGVIQRLVGTYYLEARSDEYKQRLKEWTESQGKRSSRKEIPDDLLPPIVDFDAIFIPDSAKTMGQISAMLAYNGVKGVRLMGTNLWNVPGIARRAGNSADNLLFVDSFINTDSQFASSQFVKDYKSIFNEEPGVMELQAYDSALLLRQLISQGSTSRESLARNLSEIKNIPGGISSLTISENREIQRPLVALTLQAGTIVPFVRQTQK
jgi:branched-chain amino acid transport system substrate-binding protein